MRLSRGIVDAETPKLFLEPAKVEETLGSDTVYKRELYLASENNLYIKGLGFFYIKESTTLILYLENHECLSMAPSFFKR